MLKDDQIVWAIHQMEADIGPVGPSLDSRTPFQYLISVILSAQSVHTSRQSRNACTLSLRPRRRYKLNKKS